jgi:hypothetical protein
VKHGIIDAIEIFLLLLVLLLRFLSFPVAQRIRRTIGLLVIIKHLELVKFVMVHIPIRTTARITCEAAMTRSVSTFVKSPNTPSLILLNPLH